MRSEASLLGGAILAITAPNVHAVSPAQFDAGMLKGRGISSEVANYFKLAPRYRPGTTIVSLKINGNRVGLVDAQFDTQGQLCATQEFLRRANLALPDGLRGAEESTTAQTTCYDYRQAFPQTVVILLPNENGVEMIVPPEAIRRVALPLGHYTSGGSAALFNYDLMSFFNQRPWGGNQYWQAGTELGFNTSDWFLRSRQYFVSSNGRQQWIHQYAYVQHTFIRQKSVLQAGQIGISSPLFALGQIYGAQWFPEQALAAPTASGASVRGIAQTQSRVEVRQLGALVYSTLVPAGPFTLGDLPLNSSNADLEVTVIAASGAQRRFTVPATSFNQGQIGATEGFSLAVGRLQSLGDSQTPWVFTTGNGWNLGRAANLTTGLTLTPIYRAFGLGLDAAPQASVRGTAKALASAIDTGERGVQTTLSVSYTQPRWGVSVSDLRQSAGYRELGDVTQRSMRRRKVDRDWDEYPEYRAWPFVRMRSQQAAGLFGSTNGWGGLSLSYARSQYSDNQTSSRYTGSWSQQFGIVSASISFEHATGGASYGGNVFYASLTIPLGRGSVSSYLNQMPNASRLGTRYSETVSPTFSYGLNADADTTNRSRSAGATVNLLPRYTQMSVSANSYSRGSSSFSAAMSGAVVLHSSGLTLSPHPVRDTFGVLKLGDVGGVEIQTPAGPVWTDAWGQAVIASLPEYREARVEVSTKSLPRNVDLKNGIAELQAGHGSVNQVRFDVVQVRRVLLSVRLDDGSLAPKAATVLDRDGQYVTIVMGDGKIFWNYAPARLPLRVSLPGGQECQLEFSMPEHADLQRYYERAAARCVLKGHSSPAEGGETSTKQ